MGRWYIYLHEWLILIYVYGKLVGKYTSAMDPSWVWRFLWVSQVYSPGLRPKPTGALKHAGGSDHVVSDR